MKTRDYFVQCVYIGSTALIILTNLVVVVVVVSSNRLRNNCRYLLMASLAVCDLLMGSFVCPLYVRASMERWLPECHLHLAIQVVGDYGIFFVTGWTLVTLNLTLLHRKSWLTWPCDKCGVHRLSSFTKSLILFLWPWIVGTLTLVPLLTTNTVRMRRKYTENPLCMLNLPEKVLVIVEFLTLYLPFYFIMVLTITIAACSRRTRPNTVSEPTLIENPQVVATSPSTDLEEAPSEQVAQQEPDTVEESAETSSTSRDNPMLIFIPNGVYISCYVPFVVHTWLYMADINTPYLIYIVIVAALLARSYLLPMTWFAFITFREDAADCWIRMKSAVTSCGRHTPTSSSSSVSFSRLQDSTTHEAV